MALISLVSVDKQGVYAVRVYLGTELTMTKDDLPTLEDVVARLPGGSGLVITFTGSSARRLRRLARRKEIRVLEPRNLPLIQLGSISDAYGGSISDEQRWAAVKGLLRAAGLSETHFEIALQAIRDRHAADHRASRRFPVPILFSILIGLALIRVVAPDPDRGLPLVAVAAGIAGAVFAIPPALIALVRGLTGPDVVAPRGSWRDHVLHIGLWSALVVCVYAAGWAMAVGHLHPPLPQIPRIEYQHGIDWQPLPPGPPGRSSAVLWGILIQFGAALGASMAMLQVLIYGDLRLSVEAVGLASAIGSGHRCSRAPCGSA